MDIYDALSGSWWYQMNGTDCMYWQDGEPWSPCDLLSMPTWEISWP